jgi:hypothetical protein
MSGTHTLVAWVRWGWQEPRCTAGGRCGSLPPPPAARAGEWTRRAASNKGANEALRHLNLGHTKTVVIESPHFAFSPRNGQRIPFVAYQDVTNIIVSPKLLRGGLRRAWGLSTGQTEDYNVMLGKSFCLGLTLGLACSWNVGVDYLRGPHGAAPSWARVELPSSMRCIPHHP